MRNKLKEELGIRKKFKGTFVRTGRKTGFNGYRQETILLKNIIDMETGKQVTDHIWLNYTKGFEAINIKEGLTLEFYARVSEYTKGYVNKLLTNHHKKDYKLTHPTKISISI